jgi:acyl dehydratase
MTIAKVIRYQTKPESADENERLIREVFAELAEQHPDGLRYAAFRLDDGVSFVHVALLDGDENPLTTSAAFGAFQSGIKDRCAQGPAPSDGSVVGSYRLLPDDR